VANVKPRDGVPCVYKNRRFKDGSWVWYCRHGYFGQEYGSAWCLGWEQAMSAVAEHRKAMHDL